MENEYLNNVAQQIKLHCPCFSDSEMCDLLPIAEELVNMISSSTCWQREACETLLKAPRVERIPLPCVKCGGCENVVTFVPYYNVGVEDIEVAVYTQSGLNETRTQLQYNEFNFTTIKGYPEVKIDISRYGLNCRCDSCTSGFIEITYTAGYEKLPSCLFPEVCDLISAITASKLGCGSLDECCQMSNAELGYKLKSKKVGELSWTWTQDKTSIEYLYMQLVAANRFKSLGMISLCGTEESDFDDIWAVYKEGC